MPKYYVGDFIKETRERRGYTQEELCYGICSIPSLSRIENGTQVPGSRKLNALMERLGCNNQIFNELVSKEEIKICQCITDIRRALVVRDYNELETKIYHLEPLLKEKNDFELQYLFFAKSRLLKHKGGTVDEVMDLYMQAIHKTLPEFDGINPLINNLLTYDEIAIINSIASLHVEVGKYKEALKLGFWLKEYMEERVFDDNERKKKYPLILYNLSNWLGMKKRFEEADDVAQCGIDFCIKSGTLRYFPYLIFNKACSLAEIKEMKLAKNYFIQATIIFQSMGNVEKMKKTVAWCKEKYKIDITF